jgi:hypothetical protein
VTRDDIAETRWQLRADTDFHLAGSSTAIVVSRAVADALRAGKVTNLRLAAVA